MIVSVDELIKLDIKGKVIVFPTDTVYGVGCLYDDFEAIEKIYRLKNRDYSKPMAILGSSISQVEKLVIADPIFSQFAVKYWPGALTIVAKKSELVSNLVSANLDSVGLRIPNHPSALQLLNHFGPMVATSLNQAGEPPLVEFAKVLDYENKVDYIVDGTDLPGIASTVYDIVNRKVLRQGECIVTDSF